MPLSETFLIEVKKSISIALNEQFGAAIRMLENDINACPDEVWDDRKSGPPAWKIVYHTLYFLDRYLSDNEQENNDFKNRTKENSYQRKLEEFSDRVLNKDQIHEYLKEMKMKIKTKFDNLDLEELMAEPFYKWTGSNKLSTILYNLRHFKLHVGALNARLKNKNVEVPNWVSKFKIK